MTYADSAGRARFIAGLRGLADYLESRPEVPAPGYSTVYVFPPGGDWVEMCASIDGIAASLDVTACETYGGHYAAARHFGAVEYRAVAIPPENHGSKNKESE